MSRDPNDPTEPPGPGDSILVVDPDGVATRGTPIDLGTTAERCVAGTTEYGLQPCDEPSILPATGAGTRLVVVAVLAALSIAAGAGLRQPGRRR